MHVCLSSPYPFLREWQWVAVHHHARPEAVAATLYGSWALPMDYLSYDRQHHCAWGAQQDGPASLCARVLPLLPLQRGGVRPHVWHGGPCQPSLQPGLLLWPAAPPPVHTYPFSSPFGWVVVGCGHPAGGSGGNSGCQLGSSHGLP
jgi:hypothetical protein